MGKTRSPPASLPPSGSHRPGIARLIKITYTWYIPGTKYGIYVLIVRPFVRGATCSDSENVVSAARWWVPSTNKSDSTLHVCGQFGERIDILKSCTARGRSLTTPHHTARKVISWPKEAAMPDIPQHTKHFAVGCLA